MAIPSGYLTCLANTGWPSPAMAAAYNVNRMWTFSGNPSNCVRAVTYSALLSLRTVGRYGGTLYISACHSLPVLFIGCRAFTVVTWLLLHRCHCSHRAMLFLLLIIDDWLLFCWHCCCDAHSLNAHLWHLYDVIGRPACDIVNCIPRWVFCLTFATVGFVSGAITI